MLEKPLRKVVVHLDPDLGGGRLVLLGAMAPSGHAPGVRRALACCGTQRTDVIVVT
jgi:hypothetical protein